MKRWLPVIVALGLIGCSSGSSDKAYYQLPQTTPPVMQAIAKPGARLLWIEQVAIPDYLAGNGVVYQTTDVQYVIASSNLWASPLEQQLRNTLVGNLSNMLPGWIVSSSPLGNEQDALNVTVTEFHGRYDGRVIVGGEWLLKHRGELIKRPFYIEIKQTEDGYSAMVKMLAEAWRQEAQSIASQLSQLN